MKLVCIFYFWNYFAFTYTCIFFAYWANYASNYSEELFPCDYDGAIVSLDYSCFVCSRYTVLCWWWAGNHYIYGELLELSQLLELFSRSHVVNTKNGQEDISLRFLSVWIIIILFLFWYFECQQNSSQLTIQHRL